MNLLKNLIIGAEKTKWNNQKLPATLVSLENSTILEIQKDGHL